MKEMRGESLFVFDYAHCINITALFSKSNDFDHISGVSTFDWQIKTLSDVY
jgi:hypothetical protein